MTVTDIVLFLNLWLTKAVQCVYDMNSQWMKGGKPSSEECNSLDFACHPNFELTFFSFVPSIAAKTVPPKITFFKCIK